MMVKSIELHVPIISDLFYTDISLMECTHFLHIKLANNDTESMITLNLLVKVLTLLDQMMKQTKMYLQYTPNLPVTIRLNNYAK